MPSSSWVHIPLIANLVREIKPQSILDVGVGFGKWGHLFREYTDIWEGATESKRYFRENWRVRIDGIEAYEPYITPAHQYLYDNLYVGNALDLMHSLGKYDLIYIGDVIEHFTKPQGLALLRTLLAHANRCVVAATPAYEVEQGPVYGNEYETHRSTWSEADFVQAGRCVCDVAGSEILVAILAAGDTPLPAMDLVVTRRQRNRSIWARLRRRLSGRLLKRA